MFWIPRTWEAIALKSIHTPGNANDWFLEHTTTWGMSFISSSEMLFIGPSDNPALDSLHGQFSDTGGNVAATRATRGSNQIGLLQTN